MPRSSPGWWYRPGSMGLLLAPAGALWSAATRLRWALARPYRANLPVICIGNLTAGGAGKTPAAIAVARLLAAHGEKPVFLSRGYGGTARGPSLVQPRTDKAGEVGDEPLLLARTAPAIVSADRAAGARLAERMPAGVLVMDDGFQNPQLVKDLSIVVVDRARGIGTGRVMPAGPLRAGLGFQLPRADAVILLGEGEAADAVEEWMKKHGRPVFAARMTAAGGTGWLRRKPVAAFAGIGDPGKFFDTVQSLGATLANAIPFPDHHPYTERDAQRLLDSAGDAGAQLVTTEKDYVRLDAIGGALKALRDAARPLPVRMEFDKPDALAKLLRETLVRARKR